MLLVLFFVQMSANKVLSSWGFWTDCSATCDSGTRSRQRACLGSGSGGSDPCAGQNMSENEACNNGACGGAATSTTAGNFSSSSRIRDGFSSH